MTPGLLSRYSSYISKNERAERDMCNTEWDEHDGYAPTTTVWTETLPGRVITWRVWRCQCGARTTDMFVSAKETD